MRRLPVFIVVDVSESMVGQAIAAMQKGVQLLLQALKKDPQVIEIGAISVISFGAKAKVEVPLVSVLDVRPPSFGLSSGTSLGAAFNLLKSEVDARVKKTTHEVRGDYKPIIFLITDGRPTDDWRSGYTRFRQRYPSLTIHAVGCGDDVDFSILREITPNTYVLEAMDESSFGKLFQCVTASIRSATASMMNGDGAKDDLAEWAGGEVRKPMAEECCPRSESRQVLIPAQCSKTKKLYLVRYKKDECGEFVFTAAHPLECRLEGASMSGGNINASELDFTGLCCPYCGSYDAFYCGACGQIVCLREDSMYGYCPGCGWEGELVCGDFDLRTSLG